MSPTRSSSGLSPRVRGNPRSTPYADQTQRSIPACAGEPLDCLDDLGGGQVYPRVCGGTSGVVGALLVLLGLSPRVRGNRRLAIATYVDTRSIPACAGEPSPAWGSAHQRRVYPRVCGGTVQSPVPSCRYEGLSPRVRGNHLCVTASPSGSRSIPACAGEP